MKYIDLYCAIDDSGKIDDPYPYSVYAGLVFLSSRERSSFMARYGHIVSSIRCRYCDKPALECDGVCPEIKSCRIKPQHRRQLINFIRRKLCFIVIADKQNLTHVNFRNKRSKRRFLDYSVKIVIKSVVREMMRREIFTAWDDVCLTLNIDNENRSSDGIYSFQESIRKELHEGMHHNNVFFPPIIKGELTVRIRYRDSKENYDVQSADILAGTLRRYLIRCETFQEALGRISRIADVIEIIPAQK